MRTSQNKSYLGVDMFRLIAALLVIAIHTSPLASVNGTADFILTRILARIAVPFFFTASGFFLFAKANGEKQPEVSAFVNKSAILYGISILLYLPLNVYAGTVKEWHNPLNLLRDILFNGTFYHLWYFPAAIVGACITWLLLKRLKSGQAIGVVLGLYTVGLLGDSYYGITDKITFLRAAFQALFLFFDYTRNGLFFAPVFFLMGALLANRMKRLSLKTCMLGFAFSFAAMLAEGLLLHAFRLQKHDSMYLMLVPCVFFLFQGLLLWEGKSGQRVRTISLLVYLIHPAVIVAVRGFAKAVKLQSLLIDNSILHFLAVACISFAAAIVLAPVFDLKRRTVKKGKEKHMDRAWAEISLPNLRHNVDVLRKSLPEDCKIMAVVKANAYGHGAGEISAHLNSIGINSFAVATADEAIRLRKQGIRGEILILGYTSPARAQELFRYHLSQTVADAQHAWELNRYGKPLRVHVKVNTGMNRLGESSANIKELISVFRCRNLRITGIFTHLCVSDSVEESDITFTNQQIENFYQLICQLREERLPIPPTHIQSSYGVLNYPELRCGYARIGIALYGVLSTPNTNTKLTPELKPVLALKSRVALVRTVSADESVGYGRAFKARAKTKIAVITIGYADGFPRSLSQGKGYALIGGCRAPIIGIICMDQMMADVTEIPEVNRGDIVTLIGKDGFEEITAEQAADQAGTITNELLSRLNACRLERVFLDP